MSEIFLSYASADRDRAKALADILIGQGWTVWWDRTIPPGKQFDEVIEQELDSAKCVVVLWSKASTASSWVKSEAADAMKRNILVPAMLEDVKLPLEFRRMQAADLSKWQARETNPELDKLFRSIEDLVGRKGSGQVLSGPPFGTQTVALSAQPVHAPQEPQAGASQVPDTRNGKSRSRLPLIATIAGILALIAALAGTALYIERTKRIELGQALVKERQAYEREQDERDRLARELAAKNQAAMKQAAREAAAREQAAREQTAREAAAREQAAREQTAREAVSREAAGKEQAAKERAARAQAAREQAAKEQAAKEQAAREQAAKEQAAREQAAKEQAARERAAREQAVKERAAGINVSVTNLDFGPQQVGATLNSGQRLKVEFTSQTNAPLTLDYRIGGPHAPEFRIADSNCRKSGTGGITLTENCYFAFSFYPAVEGARSAQLIVGVRGRAEPPHIIALRGIGISAPKAQPAKSKFGAIALAKPGRQVGAGVGTTAAAADDAAVGACRAAGGSECKVVTRFANGCGAIAQSANGHWGWASLLGVPNKALADRVRDNAIANCRKFAGGDTCAVRASRCAHD